MMFNGNVGGGWGPPALDAGLLQYYAELGRKGMASLGGMAGGAIGGGISAGTALAKAKDAGLDTSQMPGIGKGMLMGAAEEADPEIKKRNQEFKSLQSYAEAAYGIPKEQTNPLGLDELRGAVRGREFQEVQREKAMKDAAENRRLIVEEQNAGLAKQRFDVGNQQLRDTAALMAAYAKGPPQVGQGRGMPSLDQLDAYNGEMGRWRYAAGQVPSGVIPGMAETLMHYGVMSEAAGKQPQRLPTAPSIIQLNDPSTGKPVSVLWAPDTGKSELLPDGAKHVYPPGTTFRTEAGQAIAVRPDGTMERMGVADPMNELLSRLLNDKLGGTTTPTPPTKPGKKTKIGKYEVEY